MIHSILPEPKLSAKPKARAQLFDLEPNELPTYPLSNIEMAAAFRETASLLEQQGANPFRVQAYHNAAATLRKLKVPVARILAAGGIPALVRVPTIGQSLARSIEHLLHTGHLPLLEQLRGNAHAEKVFATVPDIGSKLAHRIHECLGIETLAELQVAANDGRLARVPGMGEKRIRAVRESLAGRFRYSTRRESEPDKTVDVAEILSIDAQYRRLAAEDALPKIAPTRLNPENKAWLPVLHAHREDRHYTALYSNSERAHRLGTLKDWVVIYRDDHQDGGRWTVITAMYGRLRGKRIVTGHEDACRNLYQNTSQPASQRAGDDKSFPRSNRKRSAS